MTYCKRCMWPLPCSSIDLRLSLQQLSCFRLVSWQSYMHYSGSFVSQQLQIEQITSTFHRDKKKTIRIKYSSTPNLKYFKKQNSWIFVGNFLLHFISRCTFDKPIYIYFHNKNGVQNHKINWFLLERQWIVKGNQKWTVHLSRIHPSIY